MADERFDWDEDFGQYLMEKWERAANDPAELDRWAKELCGPVSEPLDLTNPTCSISEESAKQLGLIKED